MGRKRLCDTIIPLLGPDPAAGAANTTTTRAASTVVDKYLAIVVTNGSRVLDEAVAEIVVVADDDDDDANIVLSRVFAVARPNIGRDGQVSVSPSEYHHVYEIVLASRGAMYLCDCREAKAYVDVVRGMHVDDLKPGGESSHSHA